MQFKKALREQVNLIVGLMGASGSGKTYSALRLATGLSQGRPFAMIDTEARRGLHYADQFSYDHLDMKAPFTPEAYAKAIMEADAAGYPAVVVDSMSHVWEGDGGILDYHEAELDRMAKDDWEKRERCSQAAWIKPKADHKRMVQRLLQVRCHLILCFRAEEKTEMVKENGKTVFRPKKSVTSVDGWIPICEKKLPFELTASFLMTAANPGIPKPIKLQEQHRALFPLNQPITEESGRGIAAWASGGAAAPAPKTGTTTQDSPAKTLAKRWGKRNPRNAGESLDAYKVRFASWASTVSGIAVSDPATMDDEAIDRCNVSLSEAESATAA